MTFFDSTTCLSGKVCHLCRDREGGREYRQAWLKAFGPKGGEVDFECPHGVAWGAARRLRGLGDAVARITTALGVKPCGGCKRRQAKLNKAIPFGK